MGASPPELARGSSPVAGRVEPHCPHRGANLYYGRVEECGIRCAFHGWKFDVDGKCVDLPTSPPESAYKDTIRLHAYPVREWEAFEAALARRNPMEPGVKTLMRLYVASAQECPLDKMGRILVPPSLRAHAGLEKEVVWVGMVKVIELWSRTGWAKAQEDARAAADSADVARVLSELRQ